MFKQVSCEIDGKIISIETGKMAKQANGSVVVKQGDTHVLATVCASKNAREGIDFMPLSVEYRERQYAAGMIPGGFFKREGRPTEKEILSSRLIDRPLRPLFPTGYCNEVQVFAYVISFDQQHDGDILGIIGSSAAMAISDIPHEAPFAAMRIGKVGSDFIFNPTLAEREESEMDIIVAGTGEDMFMIEGHAFEVSEDTLLAAFDFAKPRLAQITEMQKELMKAVGKEKIVFEAPEKPEEFIKLVQDKAREELTNIVGSDEAKQVRSSRIDELKESIKASFIEEDEEKYEELLPKVGGIVKDLLKELIRIRILDERKRLDGRAPEEIREITCEVGVLPRAHGSALFTRGETQALCVTTLGTKLDEQMIENLEGESWKSFMLHYNFPPFSVGETRPARGPGRREIGHGHLAETSLTSVIPAEESFPYTLRIVSDIMESNGSSSQATICGGSLAMMDAGVPIKAPVAGIANGLIKEGDRYVVLSDISGEEDHFGDMDFKIAGTKDGITAFQMDIKIPGISIDIMKDAMQQSLKGRLHILDKMNEALATPRTELSAYAPRIETVFIPKDKIGELIGPGGKNIRQLQEDTGTKIAIDDDGRVVIASVNADGVQKCLNYIQMMSKVPELNEVYEGTVRSIMPYGAFVEIIPGTDGLLHISEIEPRRIDKVEDVLELNQKIQVKIIGLEGGKIKLSRKALL